MGYFGADFEDGFEDKIETLPGDIFIEQQELKKLVSGEDFYIIDEPDDEYIEGVEPGVFWHYYKIWEDWHFFGLPNGLPHKEAAWLLDWLKACQMWFKQCEYANRPKWTE